jgi:selenide,water dikinase
VLVGSNTADDAGVYKLDTQTGLVVTTDFFTPIVDNPYLFGQIAAANALSDVYAMGGEPLCALNMICFPTTILDMEVFREILGGGAEKVREAGAVIIGGHSVKDNELKYGLAVTGKIDPNRIRTNRSLRPGDKLLLTKPLGTGLMTTALKNDAVTEEDISDVINSMLLLNAIPADAMGDLDISACTDVTGFGLLGHLWEMMQGAKVDVSLFLEQIPFFPASIPFAREMKHVPGGTLSNIRYIEKQLDMGMHDIWYQNLLCDPQTSGGLLISLPESEVQKYLSAVKIYPYPVKVVGEVREGTNRIFIL